MENILQIDSPEKFLLLDLLKTEKAKIGKYLNDSAAKIASAKLKGKATHQLWENRFEKERQLKVIDNLIEKTSKLQTR